MMVQTDPQARVDRLGWTAGHSFTAYGLRFGLRVNDTSVLAAARAAAPLSWQATSAGEVDVLYSLRVASPIARQGLSTNHLLYCGSELLARALDLPPVLTAF